MNTEIRNYQMFSKAGNKACESLVRKIEKKIFGTKRVTKEQIEEMIKKGFEKIGQTHSEIGDSEPESDICFFINKALKQAGYAIEIDRFEL